MPSIGNIQDRLVDQRWTAVELVIARRYSHCHQAAWAARLYMMHALAVLRIALC